ncbi:MAG: glycoside hydrolase family 2, partial [Verrucomicrobia bacterium]|nr:glycoside hydrolase family 2 [Verrucomicrobiota bacterium]
MRTIVSAALLLAASFAADPSPGPDAAGSSPPRLTPRPARVAGVAAPVLPLDSRWRFAPAAPEDPGRAMGDAGTMRAWPEIEVPGEWAMQGFVVATGAPAAYWREFDVPADWAGRRVRLRFDAVHSLCSVWVNGVPVGTNESCFAPFEFDVTAALRPGRNAIALSVTSESTADFLASATQYAAHPLGGITRKVCLFALPAAHVAEQIVEADFDPVASNGVLFVRARVDGAGAGAGLRIALLDRDGTVAASARVPVDGGRASARMVLRSVRAWEPEHPNLYALSTELLDGEAASERIEQRVGFRRIEVRGHRLLVNGVPIKLRGANRHEVHPARGRSLTPELWRRDAELFRAANCNYVRTSHYPPAGEFLDACDELGLFVECEAALCWVKHSANPGWKERNPLDPELLPQLLRANL